MATQRPVHIDSTSGNVRELVAGDKLGGVTNGTATGEVLTFDAIGVSVQAYSASTTLLGNTVTGTGSIVLATSPTLVTPVLGVASATSLTATSTTEQLRLRYDSSNYLSTTVSSAGAVTFDSVGASAAFAFNAPVSVSNGFIAGNIILYSATVSVPTATNVTINVRASTSTMAAGYCYRVRLNTAGTGTSTGAVYIINQTAATPTWVATAVSVAGSTSNHPLLLVSGSSIQVYHNHGSTYLVSYVVETIQHNNGTVNAATIWGADSLFTGTDSTSIKTASGYALGVGTLPSAKIHAVSTTEQLRLGFDSSNYYSTTVSSSGAVVLATTGTNASITLTPSGTGNVILSKIPRFNGTNSTGAGSSLLGANSPATTLTAPYTWISVITSDGSTAYIPCWK